MKMDNSKKIEWILRVAVAGEFVGHGVFALQGKKAWIAILAVCPSNVHGSVNFLISERDTGSIVSSL